MLEPQPPEPHPADSGSATLLRGARPPKDTTPTDIVGAVVGFITGALAIGGVPELLHLTANQVAMIGGLAMLAAGSIRHIVRVRRHARG